MTTLGDIFEIAADAYEERGPSARDAVLAELGPLASWYDLIGPARGRSPRCHELIGVSYFIPLLHRLRVSWTVEFEQDIVAYTNLNAEEELLQMIANALVSEGESQDGNSR